MLKKRVTIIFRQDNGIVSPNSLSQSTLFVRVDQFQTTALEILYNKIPNQLADKKICRAEASCFNSGTWLKNPRSLK